MSIASNVRPQISTSYWTPMRGYGPTINGSKEYYSYIDSYKTAGAISAAYTDAAENALNQMINAAQNAVNKVGANNDKLNEQVNANIGAMGDQADLMNQVAGQIGQQAGAVSDWAEKVGQTAGSLTPYAQSLQDYAQKVFGQGQTLVDQGNAILGTWGNFAPLVGQYTEALKSLNPNDRVSMAAHDVQRSYQNTQGQNQRALSRMGVDPSSGAYQAQKAQWDQALATALAGAKTRARNQGLTEQITQLAQGLGVGSNLAQAGASIGTQGAGVMGQAGDLLGQAANVITSQGNLYGTAGQLEQGAGQLMGTQADVYQGSGALQQAAGQLALNLGQQTQQNVLDAQKLLIDALGSASSYYNSQAAGYAQLAGRGGLVGAMAGRYNMGLPTDLRIYG